MPQARRRALHLVAAGLRVLRKVESVVREEMNAPARSNWRCRRSSRRNCGRKPNAGRSSARSCSRSATARSRSSATRRPPRKRITDFARQELASYKQLPVNFYQINTKFRDEIRPRFGVMRAREFLMKDAYLVPRRRRLARRRIPEHVRHAYGASSPGWGWSTARCRPIPARSAAAPRTNSR